MSKKDDVKAMVISEYHPDSILSSTATTRNAINGAFKYARELEPDVIFAEDTSSNIRYPGIFDGECYKYRPLGNFMDKQFDIYEEYINNLRESSPDSEIYVTLTDASWNNIRRLTRKRVLREASSNRDALKEGQNKIEEIDKKLKELREKGGSTKEIRKLAGKKGGLVRSLDALEERMVRMPRRESPEYVQGREETSGKYINELKKRSPSGVEVNEGVSETEVNGNEMKYIESSEVLSGTPKKHNFKHVLDDLNKEYIQGRVPPDFLLTSGHHGISIAHPFRHDQKHKYTLVASGLVMEDQKMVRKVYEGEKRAADLQNKQGRLEAVKRFNKAYPAAGISMVGRRDNSFFFDCYPMGHLAKVGSGEVDVKDMKYEEIPFLSDPHIGKGATSMKAFRKAVDRIRNKKPELFIGTGEMLQGRNYKTMPVETPRKDAREFEKSLEDIDDMSKDEIKEFLEDEYYSMNEPSLDNQIRLYDHEVVPLFLDILSRTSHDAGLIITEPTHIYHTVGEYNLSEIGIQSRPFEVLEDGLKQLESRGLVEIKDDSLRDLRGKIIGFNDDGCGYGRIEDFRIGDNIYNFSAEHKPGSSSSKSDIPLLGISRREHMRDVCDVKLEGHLHDGYSTVTPMKGNQVSLNLKGMTFNNYDSYGKKGGWPPATLGYIELMLSKTRDAKGPRKVNFVTSQDLL